MHAAAGRFRRPRGGVTRRFGHVTTVPLLRKLRFRRDHRWTPAQLSAYIDDELEPRARRRVARHAGDCPECRGVLHSLRRLLDALAGAPPPEPVAERLVLRFREALQRDHGD